MVLEGREAHPVWCAGLPITAREGRNAQRLLDAILSSGGEWLDVTYDV